MKIRTAITALTMVVCLVVAGSVIAATTTQTGKATSVSAAKNTITIWRRGVGTETLKVAKDAKITLDGKEVVLNRVSTPSNVVLEKEKQNDGKFIVKSIKAEKIKIVQVSGTVNAISAAEMSLVLLFKDDTTKIINADSKTVIKKDGKVIAFKDIKEKDVITAECYQEYDGVLLCKTANCKEQGSGGESGSGGSGGGCGGCGGGGCGGCGKGGGCGGGSCP